MILDKNVDDYIKPKECVMGNNTLNQPYISFTYPKSKKQMNEEYMQLVKDGRIKESKHIKNYVSCYLKCVKDKFKVITEFDKEYNKQNFRYNLTPNDMTISTNMIKKILNKEKVDFSMDKLYGDIIKQLKKYSYLKHDSEYDIIASYIILTYKFLYLDFMPIIHLNGEAGTGKSQVGKICTKLSFNASATVSATKSSFFRRIDRKRGFYFMDEKENLQDYEKELLNGCTYEGNIHTLTEKKGDNFVEVDFHIFAPVMIACISELYGATSTRTIKIETCKPPKKNKKYPVLRLSQDNKEWESIRDRLVLWTLKTSNMNDDLLKIDTKYTNFISNRGIDAWKSILNLATEIGTYYDIEKYIKEYYLDQIEEYYDNDVNLIFLKYLTKLSDGSWIKAKNIYKEFCNNELNESQRTYFSYVRFGKMMRRVGFIESKQNKRRIGSGYEYKILHELINDYISNNYDFNVSIEDEPLPIQEVVV